MIYISHIRKRRNNVSIVAHGNQLQRIVQQVTAFQLAWCWKPGVFSRQRRLVDVEFKWFTYVASRVELTRCWVFLPSGYAGAGDDYGRVVAFGSPLAVRCYRSGTYVKSNF